MVEKKPRSRVNQQEGCVAGTYAQDRLSVEKDDHLAVQLHTDLANATELKA
jgi:hypothetical protein